MMKRAKIKVERLHVFDNADAPAGVESTKDVEVRGLLADGSVKVKVGKRWGQIDSSRKELYVGFDNKPSARYSIIEVLEGELS